MEITRKVICDRCGEKFFVPSSRRVRLCEKCWIKARYGTKKQIIDNGGSNKGYETINLSEHFYKRFSRHSGEQIRRRNLKIIELNKLIEKLSQENFKLKEANTTLNHKRVEL